MNRLLLFLAVICLSFIPVRAQEMIKPEPNVAERVRLLESELERQTTKLDQLQKTLDEQQLTIKALLEKLSTQTNPTVASAKATETTTPVANSTAPAEAQSQTPTVEQRLAKVEGQALRIGPLRVSGDFRLRWDGAFRSATESPDPPLERVQKRWPPAALEV